MTILFANSKLKDSFINKRLRDAEYGEYSTNIKKRYDLLAAANTLGDISHLPPPKRHPLKGKMLGLYSITVKGPVRIRLKAKVAQGQHDLTATVVEIIDVIDYH